MNWASATLPELYTVMGHDTEATMQDKMSAAREIVRRSHKKRKPYRNNHMKIRRAVSRW